MLLSSRFRCTIAGMPIPLPPCEGGTGGWAEHVRDPKVLALRSQPRPCPPLVNRGEGGASRRHQYQGLHGDHLPRVAWDERRILRPAPITCNCENVARPRSTVSRPFAAYTPRRLHGRPPGQSKTTTARYAVLGICGRVCPDVAPGGRVFPTNRVEGIVENALRLLEHVVQILDDDVGIDGLEVRQ